MKNITVRGHDGRFIVLDVMNEEYDDFVQLFGSRDVTVGSPKANSFGEILHRAFDKAAALASQKYADVERAQRRLAAAMQDYHSACYHTDVSVAADWAIPDIEVLIGEAISLKKAMMRVMRIEERIGRMEDDEETAG